MDSGQRRNYHPASNTHHALLIMHYKLSDHLPIFINITLPNAINNLNRVKFRLFDHTNKCLFTRSLCEIEWESILTHPDVDQNFNLFYDKIHALYDKYFPVKTKIVTDKRLNTPWLTSGLLTSIRNKNLQYKKMRIGQITEEMYNAYRNRLTALIRSSKRNYYMRTFSNFKSSTKKLWKTIN